MVTFSHTVLVNDERADHPEIKIDQLWELLLHKAENPVSYVPSITGAEVIERNGDEFVRRIVLRDAVTVRERVTVEPKRQVIFTQLDNPDLTTITNGIGEDEQGRLTFILTATLSAAGIERSRRESGFIAENDLLFYDTAHATVNSVRLAAALAEARHL
ncbi:AtaL-like protein [Actinoplanes sp. NPDC048791]|uniref:AtaL-like protein n=1 Tax=Actinoplanes sp. NPDC048791 TaxID=3154623 RepID=UPI0033C4D20C